MKKRITNCILVVGFLFVTNITVAAPIVLSQVPAYKWYHGCGPTAAASVIGFWDLNGCSNLFSASGWDAVRLTVNVQDQISSPAHNLKYDHADIAGPVPEMTSIADWFETSVDPQEYGWSYQTRADDAFEGYAGYRGYDFDSYYEYWGDFVWDDLVTEIDLGNPMMFLVDSTGDGQTDHFVPVFGYDDRGSGGLWYAHYTTWSEEETIAWQQFRPASSNYSWGIEAGTFVHPLPEPATICLLGLGTLGLIRGKR